MTETPLLVSPHHLGIPQLRERVFILGIHSSLEAINLNIDINKKGKNDFSIYETGVLEDTNDDKYKISEYEEKALNIWDEFIQGVDDKVIGFPIWTSEFKKTTDISSLPKWQKEFCEKKKQKITWSQNGSGSLFAAGRPVACSRCRRPAGHARSTGKRSQGPRRSAGAKGTPEPDRRASRQPP